MVAKVAPAVDTLALQVELQTQVQVAHKLLVVLVVFQLTTFQVLQAESILVEILAMNLAAVVVVTSAAAVEETMAAAAAVQAI